MPGVVAAAMANRAPIDASTPATAVRRPDDRAPAIDATFYQVTPTYFATLGLPLLRGRDFTAADAEGGAADVAIVNDALAAALWPGDDPVGRAFVLDADGRTLRVIGVARTSKYRSLSESARPHFYRPTAPRFGLALLLRTSGDPRRALAETQRMLAEVGPGVVGFFPRTHDDHLAVDLLPARASAWAASVLGASAVAISTLGLYAIVAWYVAVRRREIGVRLALGASIPALRWLVMAQALRAAWPGLLAGCAAAVALSLLARNQLFGVAPADPRALAVGVTGLLVAALLASYVPMRRATSIDPAEVLKGE